MRSGVNVLVKRHTKEKPISLRDACSKVLNLQNKINKVGNRNAIYRLYEEELDRLKANISLILLENAKNFNVNSILEVSRNKVKVKSSSYKVFEVKTYFDNKATVLSSI